MKISRTGIDLLKKWEGCRLKAYPDPGTGGAPWTIGYGHTSAAGAPRVEKGLTITQQEADDILVRDLVKYETAVVKSLARVPSQPQFDAMVSLCYNIGPGAFAGSSVVRRFNDGDLPGAADAFLLWNKAGGRVMQGLTNRRKAERAMFLSASAKPVEAIQTSPAPTPPVEETPPVPPPALPDAGKGVAAVIIAALGAVIAAVVAMFFGGK